MIPAVPSGDGLQSLAPLHLWQESCCEEILPVSTVGPKTIKKSASLSALQPPQNVTMTMEAARNICFRHVLGLLKGQANGSRRIDFCDKPQPPAHLQIDVLLQ